MTNPKIQEYLWWLVLALYQLFQKHLVNIFKNSFVTWSLMNKQSNFNEPAIHKDLFKVMSLDLWIGYTEGSKLAELIINVFWKLSFITVSPKLHTQRTSMCQTSSNTKVNAGFYYPDLCDPEHASHKFAYGTRQKNPALFFLFLIALLGICFHCRGQVIVRHQIIHYGGGNGLDQNSVRNAAVDAWGYVWLATQSGLVRFDGRNFRNFNSSDIPGLSNDRIANVGTSPEGQIWAQTANNQFITIFQTDRRMTPVPRVVAEKQIIPVSGYVRESSPEIEPLIRDLEKKENGNVALTACTRSREVYSLIGGMIYYISRGQRTLIDSMPKTHAGRPGSNLNFTVTNNDVYMHLFADNHVKAWRRGKRMPEITRLEGDVLADAVAFPFNNFSLMWSSSGSLLYTGKNVYRIFFKNGRLTTERMIYNIDIEKDLSAIQYIEKENKFILCRKGGGGGLSVIHPDLFSYPTLPKQIRSPSFFSQLKTGPKELYARNFTFSQRGSYRSLPAGTDMNDDNRTGYLSVSGELYFENNMHLLKYNMHSKTTDSLVTTDGLIKAIRPDRFSKDLLFCTQFSINRLTSDHSLRSWKIPGNSYVTTFLQIDPDRFLIGTDNGMKWFNTRKNRIEKSILDSASIWSLYRETNGNIWISTYGKGFYLFDGTKLTTFPLGPRNALKTVHSFIDDGRGCFWLPTNDGLFKVSKKELASYTGKGSDDVYYFRFDKRDGLTNNEFNGGSTPSHLWLADSMLSIPAIDGLVWFYPNRTSAFFPQNPVLLEKLILNGQPVSADSIADLSAGNHTIELQVSTSFMGNPENLRLEYQVSGYSTRWEVPQQDGKILLQNFPSGSYNLIFRKRKNDDPSQYDTLRIPFRIAPFFYDTFWFYTFVALVLVALAYLFIRWRTRNLELVAKRLELKVEERTSVLNKTIVQLEDSQNQLRESDQIKDRLVSMVLHDLRSPIRFLDMMGTRLVRNHRTLDADTLTERIAEIGNSTSSIYSYVNQFLTWTSTQHGLYSVRQRWIALAPLFESISELYTEIARYHENTLTLDHGDIHCQTDPDLVMAILRNLVDNAMKYTHGGQISVVAKIEGEEVKITVADTGSGMSQAQIAVFYGKASQETYAGLGSTLVRDLLQKLEGRLLIESSLGTGTAITVYLTSGHPPDHENGPSS